VKSTPTPKNPSPPSKSAWTPPLKAAGVTQPVKQPQHWKPHSYQKKAVKFLLERGAGALFLDPGLGKTSITAAVLKVLKAAGQMRGCLVIAPLRVCKLVWPAEFTKWKDFEGLSVGVLHGDKKQQVLEQDHDIYVINHAGLPWLFERTKKKKDGTLGKTWNHNLTPAGKLLMGKVNILVLDELSKFKHVDTQRFKAIKPWLPKFDRRYGLTGSPASNGLLDLFGQCYMLDGGRSLGPFITYYQSQYFTPVRKDSFDLVLKPGAEELIYERIRPLALRMSAEDHLTLPKIRNYPIKLDLPPAMRARYEEVEDDFLTIIQDELLTTPNAAGAMMMCRQMCSGAVYTNAVDAITGIKKTGPRKWVHLHDVKLDAMEDLMDELQGQQLLVAYDFQHDLERILKRWPSMPYFGKSEKEDARLERLWNAGELPVVAGHPGSIGHGLNLQDSHAHNVLWFTLTWDYELFDQFIRRLMRQGNKAEYLNCSMLIMRDTVEEYVATVLKKKKRTQDDLHAALKLRSRLDD
jgi:SNF2 family DNA or RNA helicase